MSEKVIIQVNEPELYKLIKNNISCHMNKVLDEELVMSLAVQIIDSINFFLNSEL